MWQEWVCTYSGKGLALLLGQHNYFLANEKWFGILNLATNMDPFKWINSTIESISDI